MLSNYFICSFQIDNRDPIKMYITSCNSEIDPVIAYTYQGISNKLGVMLVNSTKLERNRIFIFHFFIELENNFLKTFMKWVIHKKGTHKSGNIIRILWKKPQNPVKIYFPILTTSIYTDILIPYSLFL